MLQVQHSSVFSFQHGIACLKKAIKLLAYYKYIWLTVSRSIFFLFLIFKTTVELLIYFNEKYESTAYLLYGNYYNG
jgi:hypothetical protein